MELLLACKKIDDRLAQDDQTGCPEGQSSIASSRRTREHKYRSGHLGAQHYTEDECGESIPDRVRFPEAG